MNANELMIGDWVNRRIGWKNEETGKVEYETETAFPIKITSIYDDLVIYEEVLYDNTIQGIEAADYELYPIPLTPEILEKNGFLLMDGWQLKVDRAYIRIKFTDKVSIEIQNLLKGKDDKGRCDIVQYDRDWCDTFYVHELQHALRLCGIDKQIEL